MQMVQQTYIVLHKTKETSGISLAERCHRYLSLLDSSLGHCNRRQPFKGGDFLVLESKDKED